jgi:hypothetical protein
LEHPLGLLYIQYTRGWRSVRFSLLPAPLHPKTQSDFWDEPQMEIADDDCRCHIGYTPRDTKALEEGSTETGHMREERRGTPEVTE